MLGNDEGFVLCNGIYKKTPLQAIPVVAAGICGNRLLSLGEIRFQTGLPSFMIIDTNLLDAVTAQAKESPRLRKNFNFHQSLEEKCHRFLNALEPGTVVPIHHHPTKDESVVVLRGRLRVSTYDDCGAVTGSWVLCAEEGNHGVNIPKNVWHTVESLASGTVVFECQEGPFVEHEAEGVLKV